MALPATTERVVLHSAEWKTRRIERDMEQRLWYYLDHPEEIEKRLRELDEEWDIERLLETNASTIALVGLGLGTALSRKFYLLSALVMGFLLQHALQGWCPPVPLFRRLRIRTQSEIEMERYALKALRGDFGVLAASDSSMENNRFPEMVLEAVRK
ncbi:hypothetical protein [Geobacter argillaceus]|uniref:DUF2892 family protein n=1 Tax=Geobacter argillaceus TaxID=345631 RepID=A0A562VF89_9BACT|nr:hypothetical protein [Geobacter argillaceus]TWJ16569.1 hypothetical protein JN12_03324 [Geobacter argillaceus]